MRKEVHRNMRKGWTPLTWGIVGLILTLGSAAQASFLPLVDIEPSDQPAICGDLIQVEVWIKDVEAFYAYDMEITFDTGILEYVNGDYTAFMDDSFSPVDPPALTGPGAVHIAQTHLASEPGQDPGISGSGALAVLTFRAIGLGTAMIGFNNVELVGFGIPFGVPIEEFDLSPGYVRVTECPGPRVPEPGTLALLVGGGLVALGKRRRSRRR